MTDRTTLIAGAAGGIGGAVLARRVAAGDRVIATVRNDAEANQVENATVGEVSVMSLDLADADAVAAALRDGLAQHPRLDAVVNCAAIAPFGPLELQSVSGLRDTLEVNTLSALAIYQATVPLLRETRGRLVYLSSFAGKVAVPFIGAYAASKFALEALADVMRREARAFGVDVVLVEPGATKTPMVDAQSDGIAGQRAGLDVEEEARYGQLYDVFAQAFAQSAQNGMDPAEVAESVDKALTDERPSARYVVGADAVQMCDVVAALPDAEADEAIAGFLAQFAG